MSESPGPAHDSSNGLGRWLLGGLVAGGIVLGLLIAAYAVGYHRGRHHATRQAAPATRTTTTPGKTTPAPAPPKPTPPKPTTTTATTTTAVTPALIARGKALYQSDSCAGCHSLTGSAGAGPSFKGLAGSTVTLDTGTTVVADQAYLERSIDDPDAEIVKGYHAGIMPPSIAGFDLAHKPNDVQALVAFIQSQK